MKQRTAVHTLVVELHYDAEELPPDLWDVMKDDPRYAIDYLRALVHSAKPKEISVRWG